MRVVNRREIKNKFCIIFILFVVFICISMNKMIRFILTEKNCMYCLDINSKYFVNLSDDGNEDITRARGKATVREESHSSKLIRSSSDHNVQVFDKTIDIRDDKVDAMIESLHMQRGEPFFSEDFSEVSFSNLVSNLGVQARKSAKTLSYYEKYSSKDNLPSWSKLHMNIRQFSLYDPDDPNLDKVMHEMATLPIISAVPGTGGTQLKLVVRFFNGGRALIKPMRYKREVEANENHYAIDDMERHVAEIAAFQLDKLLGFYRVPPTVGRRVNITELRPKFPASVAKTVFTSPAGNLCFYGSCKLYCDHAHAFCGNPDTIEISVQSYLPSEKVAPRESHKQPWKRSYSMVRKAYWETHDDMCQKVRNEPPHNNGKLLLDLIDVHTFDFLMGNKDRHNIAVFKEFGHYSFPILYDNGNGFGRQTYDAMSILAPLKQCCIIRKSTLLKYITLYTGPDKLSSLMEKALESDPVAPVLLRGYLDALDRRLVKILQAVATCLEHNTINEVIVSDRF